jgi:peptide/nickel transport system permease protein
VIGYIVRRLLWGLVVLGLVAVLTFILIYVLPGDPARAVAGIHASPEDVARIREALGLDEPFLGQFGRYVGRLVTGDFGYSFHRRTEILPLLLERFPATLQLALGGLAVGLAIGLPLGVLSARRRGTSTDRTATATTAVLVAIPSFWLGYVLLDLLAFRPLVAAYYTRITRTVMLDHLGSDYVRTAEAKGLDDRLVVWRHAFRNAMPPLVTQVGIDAGFLLGGVVLVEQVYSWPGIGRLAVESITQTDVPMIMATVVFATLMIVVANLIADIVVAFIDPRVRLRG